MLVGSNPEEAHPVVGMQIRQAVQRGCKIIVADPRDIGACTACGYSSETSSGNKRCVCERHHARDHRRRSSGYEVYRRANGRLRKDQEIVKDYTPEKVGEICHIDPGGT